MPRFVVVKRDYPHVFDQMTSLGPLAAGVVATKGIAIAGGPGYAEVRRRNGAVAAGRFAEGMPSLHDGSQAVEAILALSGATDGHRAMDGWKALEKPTGLSLAGIAAGHEETSYNLADLSAQPRLALAAPVWSGLEKADRRYSPFTVNVEYRVPWRTLTGRQHFYLDHEVMLEYGEGLPLYRPPLTHPPFHGSDLAVGDDGVKQVSVRYLTPHQKWGIHSTYTDTPRMLTLFRGGQTIWLSEEDAVSLGVKDNDWVEVYNRNGAIAARAVVSYRLPAGVAMMYHAQDHTIGVPGSALTKERGGTHNSVTRVIPKPTHMIGGYAQLSYGFNYYGPTGHQRDVITLIRPLKEVDWLEN